MVTMEKKKAQALTSLILKKIQLHCQILLILENLYLPLQSSIQVLFFFVIESIIEPKLVLQKINLVDVKCKVEVSSRMYSSRCILCN